MNIRTNIPSLCAFNERNKTVKATSKNIERLSSGYRINRAADDAAGLGISEKMRAKITELRRCQNNVQEGIDLANTADAALAEVNEILRRAHSLCLQAENGTYGELERAKFNDELNQLFEEVDRITAGTKFNSIRLFRGEIEEEYYLDRVENFEPLRPGELATWGEMTFIHSDDFDKAAPAEPAKTSFELADSIDLNDITTLEGKSIKIGNRTYLFSSTENANYNVATSSTAGSTTRISLTQYNTVQKALEAITHYPTPTSTSTATSDIEKVEIDGRTVTLTAKLKSLNYSVEADGKTNNYSVENGDGTPMNGVLVQNALGGDTFISQVDGTGAVNNQPSYTNPATGTITLFNGGSMTEKLSQNQADNLNKNTLNFYIDGTNKLSIALSSINPQKDMTRESFAKALVNAINGKKDSSNNTYAATYNTNGTISVSITNPSGKSQRVSISEGYTSTSGHYDYGTAWTSSVLGIQVQSTPSTNETPEKATITIPQNLSAPFSFTLGNTTYIYHDSSKDKLKYDSYDRTSYSGGASYHTTYDTNGKSASEIQADVLSKIQSYAQGSGTYGAKVIRNGNTLTIEANNIGDDLKLTQNIKGASVTVTPYKYTSGSNTSELGLTFRQKTEVSFSLGNSFNINDLVGKGFSIAVGSSPTSATYKRYEFTNGSTGQHSDYTDIDISSCTDFTSLQNTIQSKLNSDYKVAIDSSGNMTISIEKIPSYTVYVTDGTEGIMADSPATFSGGTEVGYSHKELDFSSIDSSNIETLLGKGFRINCATCAGEYINVFFCWENDGSVPPLFERLDEETGEMRTIHNIPVELSKVTSGDQIVEDIVRQVSPSLNHYTAVEVGEPPTTLIARDKRRGDVRDFNDTTKLYLGKVQTGVETNFTYDTSEDEVLILPGDGDELEFHNTEVKIFVGSNPEPQFIPIHLPYLDLPYLRLSPPETVDLNDPKQNADDWLTRVDDANMAIASARGIIGADYNRLEHTFNELSSYEENLTESESVIRDANFAQEVMNQIKLQILTQSQQAMLSQANTVPQQVLQLLQ